MHKLIFLFLFLPSFCFGQSFGSMNAEWVYDYRGGGVTIVKNDREIKVNGNSVKVFTKTLLRLRNGMVETFTGDLLYIMDEDGIVLSSKNSIHFDTLYNFQTPVGSSWTFRGRNEDGTFNGQSLEGKVLNKFEYNYNGKNVKCLEVQNGNDIVVDTICSNIGSRVFYIEPFDYFKENTDNYEGGVLRCFSNDELGVVKFEHPWAYYGGSYSSFEYECDQLSEISDAESTSSTFDIYPNPVSDILHIKGKVENIDQIKIYNLHGQLVLHEQSDGAFIEVDVAGMSSGLYCVILNRKYFEKIAIHRN